MKRGLIIFGLVLILVGFASAATYYVSPSGSASWSSCTNINTPCSLSTANSNAAAGDVIILRDGTYTTTISPSHSGNTGSPITYRAEHQHGAIYNGASHIAYLNGVDHITIDGVYGLMTTSQWIVLHTSNYNIIQNSRFKEARSWGGIQFEHDSKYNKILNNIFEDAPYSGDGGCAYPSDTIYHAGGYTGVPSDSGYNVVEGNTFGVSGHAAINPEFSHHWVVKNNTIIQRFHTAGGNSAYGLVEGNNIYDCGVDHWYERGNGCGENKYWRAGHVAIQNAYEGDIIRNNVIDNCGVGLHLYADGITYPLATTGDYMHIYSNTINDAVKLMNFVTNADSATGDIIKNNAFSRVYQTINAGDWPDVPEWDDPDTYGVAYIGYFTGDFSNLLLSHNNFWDDAPQGEQPSSPVDYWRFQGTYGTLAQIVSAHPSNFDGNLQQNPKYVNIDKRDFSLQSNSYLIDAGAWLTTITSSTGSGKTSFTVEDSLYFYDGWGIPGEVGDTIKTQNGQTTTIQSINYDTKTITVSPAISIVNGEGLALDYSGSRPDIGAIEYTSTTTTHSCTGSIPTNAFAYDSEESTGLAIDTPWTYSATDTATKCQCHCNSGYSWIGGACVQQSTNTYTILKTQTPPTIDGNLNEFTKAKSITITNSNGNSLTYKMLWDNNNLYIAAQGSDSQLAALNTTRDGALWNDDAIELFFDTLNDGGTSMNSNDYKFLVNLLNTQKDSNAFSSSWNTVFSSHVTTTGIINNDADADTGYMIEVAIPWTDWANPSDNDVWGFDVSMDDRNDAGNVIQKAWSQTNVGNIPDEFGDVVFSSNFVSSGSACNSLADANIDGQISISELINYISRWKAGSVTIGNLIDAIGKWKSGC